MIRLVAVFAFLVAFAGSSWADYDDTVDTESPYFDPYADDRAIADNGNDFTLKDDWYPCSYEVTTLKGRDGNAAINPKEPWKMHIQAYTKSMEDCAKQASFHCYTWIDQSTPVFVIAHSDKGKAKPRRVDCD